jgi:hypothetical protein
LTHFEQNNLSCEQSVWETRPKGATIGARRGFEQAGERGAHDVSASEPALGGDLAQTLFGLLNFPADCLQADSVDVLSWRLTKLLPESAAKGTQTHPSPASQNRKREIAAQIFGDPDSKFPKRFLLSCLAHQS